MVWMIPGLFTLLPSDGHLGDLQASVRNNLELRYFCTGMSVSIRYSPTGGIGAQKFLHLSLKKKKKQNWPL